MQSRIHLSLLVWGALLITLTSCRKSGKNSQPDLYKNSPATAVPDELQGGRWFWGGIGPVSYYDRDGHEVGNGTEAAREYSFSEVDGKGRFEFIQYLGMRNSYNCVTEIYTSKKGTIAFDGTDKLTLYPVEGIFKTIKKGCSDSGTTERKATVDDLKPETYLWELKKISGESLLYIYDSKDVTKQDPLFVYSYAQ